MDEARVLVVEDEPSIADSVLYALKNDGYEAIGAATGEAARAAIEAQAVDLVLLDIGLPDVSGWSLGRELIDRGIPVVFLTSRHSEIDRVAGLEMGGDDYVVKPFSPRELVARVRAVLRRNTRKEGASEKGLGGLVFEAESYRAFVSGEDLELTRNEYRLLETLASRPGRVFSRDELLHLAWEDSGASQDRTVDAHVKQLRAKIRTVDPDFDPIETRRGFGYCLKRSE